MTNEEQRNRVRNILQDFYRRDEYELEQATDDVMRLIPSLPPAEGAEEILEGVMVENGFTYVSFPAFVENESSIDVFDIACKAMTEFATLHAQRLAEKMVWERLREELIDFAKWQDDEIKVDRTEGWLRLIDKYLKSRDSHEQHR